MGAGPTRFVILCLGRTGSTYLVDLLDSHPGILCYSEILNETFPAAAPKGWIGSADTVDAREHATELLTTAPAHLGAVGFKLPINSIRDRPEMRDWLAADPALVVIRLRRRNRLAILVSRKLVRASLVSQSIHGSYIDHPIEIEPRACLRALEQIESDDAELDELATGHPTIEVAYEELGSAETQSHIQRSLGVEPAALSSGLERLRKRPLAETIANWDELSTVLSQTRFAPMLED